MRIQDILMAINFGNAASVVGFVLLVLALAWPLVCVWRFFLLYVRDKPQGEIVPLPHAAVLLPLRGADPSLRDCLDGLIQQNYPSYEIVIVVDSRNDPAWDVVQQVLTDHRHSTIPVRVELLEEPLSTCSLKLSAQLQALAGLEQDCEVVVLIDADVTPNSTWLSDLVRPLYQPGIGASTGIRWYAPGDQSWGSLIRYSWNAVSSSYMLALGIPWGGSLAFRRTLLQKANLSEIWAHCFGEDTSCVAPLRALGLHLAFVPEATSFNTEAIDLASCLRFICRQLLTVRLHHPQWKSIIATSLSLGIALVVAPLLGLVAALGGNLAWALSLSSLAILYGGFAFVFLILIERRLRAYARTRGETLPPFPLSWSVVVALPLVHVLHLACMVSVAFLRRVSWRGIDYEVSKNSVRLLEYQPYQPGEVAAEDSLV